MNPNEKTPSMEVNELSKIDTSDLISLLEEYNHQFNFGTLLAKGMMKSFGDEKGIGLDEVAADEILSFENIKITAEPILSQTGLEFQPVDTSFGIYTNEGKHQTKEMRLNIADGKKLIAYLNSLNIETMNDSQKEGVTKVIDILSKQIKLYDLNNPDNAFFELMINLPDIISEFERLGFNNLTALKKYHEYGQKGCLKEYMAANELDLTKDFDPKVRTYVLRWHIDSTPEIFQKYWDELFEVLTMIHNNEKASELYDQAKSTAQKAIDNSLSELEKMRQDEKSEEYANKLNAVAQTIKARLAEF
jgi:hypothetical protein